MKKLLYYFMCLSSVMVFSQAKVKDTITRRANITYNQKANAVTFKPETPPLIPIAGAPKPSYSYLWELGDGHYSKQAEPKHVYKKKGTYTARLTVTNNYDNGKPPATRPKKVAVNEIENDLYQDIASIADQNGFAIQKNCDPIPDQEMVVVLSYQNLENYVASGKLYLFYNEKQFKNNNFKLLDFRTYAGEYEVKENTLASATDLDESKTYLASAENTFKSKKYKNTTTEEDLEASLAEANSLYKNVSILDFDNADPGETRNIFYTFKTTPEMIKDTSATVTMRGIFVPNRSFKNHKIKNLEMEIVTSHDPNKMGSNGSFINYRLVRFKRVKFKTRFQNNGEGPARMIRLETDIPDMFDKKTFQIESMYPECPICPKDEVPTISCLDTIIKQKQIFFTFKNIYLPGSNQKNVKEIDSTKGFVRYSMKFNEDFHKVKTKSRTAIIFDKNEPIITNYATTRFLPGISIGAKAGYNIYSDLEKATSYFVGATISPFKSYRFYWQVEWLNALNKYESKASVTDEIVVNPNGVKQLQRTTISAENKNVNWEIPILIRYNINNYFGIGAGIQANVNVSEENDQTIKIENFEGADSRFLINTRTQSSSFKNSFTSYNAGLLLDLTAGFSRIGPSFGARYVMNLEQNFNYIQLYGIWRF
ncbi:PKD domain-containing protein [Flavobacterium sp. Fl-77]|uniref:PKD domain-containing protein n=1 Tax=Flavobacterium flavipigmentatum TaxID=2893884 RepID=A0AAJ2SBJ7_9FLAO|nr:MULTISPECIES: PKD domain-containing protein [unclassified Flavobacterium]MDX6181191.1 PKD domain-containing protein [Flavobacterium sp. Fl-33]MDX6184792.1 PKD domain-containing protein [Flavobacterium sp. Fl-77]UFH39889.1 PKD domain-containing protein [Flavobacterium sp. F-70]